MKTYFSPRLVLAALLSAVCLQAPPLAQAGCGCDKAPPAPAAVRPHATYAGMDITLFDASLDQRAHPRKKLRFGMRLGAENGKFSPENPPPESKMRA